MKKTDPQTGISSIKRHQKAVFSKVMTRRPNDEVKTVFIPGCSLSGYSNDVVQNTYQYLKTQIPNIGLMVQCCGRPSYDIGDGDQISHQMSSLQLYIKEQNITEIIVACENCFQEFKEKIENVKVKTIYEVIAEKGVPANLIHYYEDLSVVYALHDPCPIRDQPQIHDSVRMILNELGINFIEFERNRAQTICCGSKGMLESINPDLWNIQRNKRANSTEAAYIVSYCQSCVKSLRTNDKKTIHLLDFLFNQKVIDREIVSQEALSKSIEWVNRFKLARSKND